MRTTRPLYCMMFLWFIVQSLYGQNVTSSYIDFQIEQGVSFIGKNHNDSLKVTIENLLDVKNKTYDDERLKAYINLMQGHYYKRSKVDSALVYGQLSMEYFKKKKKFKEVAIAYMIVGSAYSNKGEMNRSFDLLIDGVQYIESNASLENEEIVRKIARMKYNAGFTMLRFGDLDKSAELFEQARKDAIELKDNYLLAHVYNQIGNINIYRERHDEAIEYNRKALSLLDVNNVNSRTYIHGAIGASYGEMGVLDSARFYLERVVDIRKKGDNKYSLAVALMNLSDIDRQEGLCDQAISKNKQVYKISSTNNLQNLLLNAQINLCECHYELGNYGQAMTYSKEGIKIINKVPHHKTASDMYSCASKTAEAQGNLSLGLEYFKKHKMYADSLLNEKTETAIEEIQAKLKVAEKEASITQLEEQATIRDLKYRQRILWMILGVGLIGVVTFTYSVQSRKRVLVAEKRRAEIEQKLLRFQMNPHFIFNAISSIQNYLFDKSDLKIALTYLSKFADLMRQTLEHSREAHISLEKELDSLENYLMLQQLRYQNTFNYELNVSEDINPAELLVPPLIAQPFVENAIEHGQIYQIPDGKVSINVGRSNDQLQLTIQDNGVGISQMAIKEVSSIKMKKSLATIITKERLSALSKEGKKKFDLIVENLQQGGTLVTIDLPIIAAA